MYHNNDLFWVKHKFFKQKLFFLRLKLIFIAIQEEDIHVMDVA